MSSPPRPTRRVFQALLACLAVVVLVVAVHTATLSSLQPAPATPSTISVDVDAAATRLAGALRFATVSSEPDEARREAAFAGLRAHLAASFPATHARLTHERVGGASLYRWSGSDAGLAPVVLMAHLDVVPVGQPERWTHPPFAGVVADGFVWGRGAWDDKSGVLGILEAVEALLAHGFVPRRTVLLAFGHDEEIGGSGAAAIAARLAAAGVRPAFVLDEGGLVSEGLVPGVPGPVALIGVAEKGYLTLRLRATAPGGHSSMPPRDSATGKLARALARLENRPFPAHLHGVTGEMLAHLAPEMELAPRVAMGNLWLTGPLVLRQLLTSASSAAAVRTTTAITSIQAGIKENVLPGAATALINLRLLPGDGVDEAIGRVRATIHDPGVSVETVGEPSEASAVSDPTAASFALVASAARAVFPGAVAAPYLVVGATDARHFEGLTPHVYRFLPVRATANDLARFHGTDERVGVAGFGEAIRFYATLIETSSR